VRPEPGKKPKKHGWRVPKDVFARIDNSQSLAQHSSHDPQETTLAAFAAAAATQDRDC
jgi:hypothetical protein